MSTFNLALESVKKLVLTFQKDESFYLNYKCERSNKGINQFFHQLYGLQEEKIKIVEDIT